ncbi:hypothetical protein KI688_007723 [Linnemannia hyalina]|uniref:Septin-type G domain-containing protein n=1 Tax=Linnemannia hyalina TaxID=64524 RepID=A0A9P7XJH3_9FUNG|nr:hypothetical protein KI688_007723 [Linnemannia hyalina]
MPSFVPSTDNHPQQLQSSAAGAPSDTAARQGSRMQRFTRLEDLADLEDLTVRLPATAPSASLSRVTPVVSSHSHTNRSNGNGEQHNDFEQDHEREERREQDERTRQYIEAHTTFLDSADTEGSGYIPPRPSVTTTAAEAGYSLHHRHYHDHHPLDEHSHASASASASRTTAYYPSSLAEDEDYTTPRTPNSFLSSPSLGYYSHPSRPPSQTGYWQDQGGSSFNLIMPSSAMFVKSREPTAEGDKLGFVKLMVAGQSRVWNSRLIQDMFQWDGVIANDFDDEFLQDPLLNDSDTVAAVAGSNGVGVREAIVEHYASSMVLPAWARAGFEDQELHQEILVKNICIVDTPGYSAFNNPNRAMDLVISYLGLQFQTTNEFFSRSALSDDSLGRFLANNTTGAHSHVDACLYVIEGQLSEIDILFMQRLQPWVNLIPVLIPPSTHLWERERERVPQEGQEEEDVIMFTPTNTTEMIASARMDLIRQLKEHEIHIYGIDLDGALSDPPISTSSNSSPFTTAESPEADLASPPLLALDGINLLSPEFTSPPFIFHVPPSLMEDTGVGQLDRDVLQLDVVTTQESKDPQDDEDGSDNGHHSTLLPTIPQHRASSALGVQEDLPDLGPLRRWVYVKHLAALRHHTTQKFLSWRRHLPLMPNLESPMESSQDSGSYRQQQRRHHNSHGGQLPQQQSLNAFSSYSGLGSHRPALSTATHSPPPSISVTRLNHPLQQQHLSNQRTMPTDMLGDLRAQDQVRISEKVVRMLETQGQVFERILQERQVAWRQALEGMEREQRIEFLMHELRRWANEGPNSKEQTRELERGGSKQKRLDVQYREGSRDSEWGSAGGGAGVGLGLGASGVAVGSAVATVPAEPSLRDALLSVEYGVGVSNSVRATTTSVSRRKSHKSKYAGGRDPRSTKKSRSSASSSKVSSTPASPHREDVDMQHSKIDVAMPFTSILEPNVTSLLPIWIRASINASYASSTTIGFASATVSNAVTASFWSREPPAHQSSGYKRNRQADTYESVKLEKDDGRWELKKNKRFVDNAAYSLNLVKTCSVQAAAVADATYSNISNILKAHSQHANSAAPAAHSFSQQLLTITQDTNKSNSINTSHPSSSCQLYHHHHHHHQRRRLRSVPILPSEIR